jgi:hypothetical protein
MWTALLRSVYYDAVPFFDHGQEVLTGVVSDGQMPIGYNGLIAVGVLAAIQWILTLIIVAMFIFRGKYAVLHQAWATVSELWTSQIRALVGNG